MIKTHCEKIGNSKPKDFDIGGTRKFKINLVPHMLIVLLMYFKNTKAYAFCNK